MITIALIIIAAAMADITERLITDIGYRMELHRINRKRYDSISVRRMEGKLS